MAKTRNGVKKSKSRHQPYSKRTTTTTTEYVATSNEPDPEYIPSSSTRKKALNFNLSDNDSEPVSKNLRSRTLEQRNRQRNSENGFNNFEHDVQNAVNLDQILLSPQPSSSSPNQVVHQYSVRANSPPSPELPSTSSSSSYFTTSSSSNENSSVPIPNSTSDNLNNNSSSSSSSGRRSKRKRKHNRNNSNNNNNSSSSSTVPETVGLSEPINSSVNQLNNVPNNTSHPIQNNINTPAVSSELPQATNFQTFQPPQNLTNNANSISTEQSNNNTNNPGETSLENIPIDNQQNVGEDEEGSGGSLSPYQRVTRNLYRSGHVGQMYDPDIELDVFEEYARIRMGTMNMTVSMIENQTVV